MMYMSTLALIITKMIREKTPDVLAPMVPKKCFSKALYVFTQRLSHVSQSQSLIPTLPQNSFYLNFIPTAQSLIRCIIELTYLLNNARQGKLNLQIELRRSPDSIMALYREAKQGVAGASIQQLYQKLLGLVDVGVQQGQMEWEKAGWELLKKFKNQVRAIIELPANEFAEEVEKTELFNLHSSFLKISRNILIPQLSKHQSENFTLLHNLKMRWLMEHKRIMPVSRKDTIFNLLAKFNTIQQAYSDLFYDTKPEEKAQKQAIDFVGNIRGFLLNMEWKELSYQPESEEGVVTLIYQRYPISQTDPLLYRIMLARYSPSWLCVQAISNLQSPNYRLDSKSSYQANVNYHLQNCQYLSQKFPGLTVFSYQLPVSERKGRSFITFKAEYNDASKDGLSEVIDKIVLLIEEATIGATLLKPFMMSGKNLSEKSRYQVPEVVKDVEHYNKMVKVWYRARLRDDITVEH